jgi:uncharacterized membrane protein YdjX (TVP38/TMEM64 family)
MKPAVLLRIGFAAVLLAAVVAGLALLPVQQLLERFLEWIKCSGAWGLVLFVLLYVIVCLILMPGSVLTLAGGFIFGFTKGIAAASLGSTLGATAAFAIGRLAGRQWLEQRLTIHPRILAVDRAIGNQAFRIVLLIRLCSLFPLALMSYVFGLSKVPTGKFVLATWLGRLPGTIVWAYLGSNAKSLADLLAGRIQSGLGEQILLWLGLAAMAAVTIIITEIARRAVREAVNAPEASKTLQENSLCDKRN